MSTPHVTLDKQFFSLSCSVEVIIGASAERVWAILTNAKDYGRWNSTVARVEGEIVEGGRLKIHVPGTTRIFTPAVSEVVPNRQMIWSDGINGVFKGVRRFELNPCPDGSTKFSMAECFSGVMLLFAKNALPDFRPIFGSFAADLKREAEKSGGSPSNPV